MPLNGITVISLKSYLVRRDLGKDERRAGFFHAETLIVPFCDLRVGKNLNTFEAKYCLFPSNFASSDGVRIDERRQVYRPPLQF
jgi:hypothetical protein